MCKEYDWLKGNKVRVTKAERDLVRKKVKKVN
jgi:hypothetical protein